MSVSHSRDAYVKCTRDIPHHRVTDEPFPPFWSTQLFRKLGPPTLLARVGIEVGFNSGPEVLEGSKDEYMCLEIREVHKGGNKNIPSDRVGGRDTVAWKWLVSVRRVFRICGVEGNDGFAVAVGSEGLVRGHGKSCEA